MWKPGALKRSPLLPRHALPSLFSSSGSADPRRHGGSELKASGELNCSLYRRRDFGFSAWALSRFKFQAEHVGDAEMRSRSPEPLRASEASAIVGVPVKVQHLSRIGKYK